MAQPENGNIFSRHPLFSGVRLSEQTNKRINERTPVYLCSSRPSIGSLLLLAFLISLHYFCVYALRNCFICWIKRKQHKEKWECFEDCLSRQRSKAALSIPRFKLCFRLKCWCMQSFEPQFCVCEWVENLHSLRDRIENVINVFDYGISFPETNNKTSHFAIWDFRKWFS